MSAFVEPAQTFDSQFQISYNNDAQIFVCIDKFYLLGILLDYLMCIQDPMQNVRAIFQLQ
jgi:hypothetical protein